MRVRVCVGEVSEHRKEFRKKKTKLENKNNGQLVSYVLGHLLHVLAAVSCRLLLSPLLLAFLVCLRLLAIARAQSIHPHLNQSLMCVCVCKWSKKGKHFNRGSNHSNLCVCVCVDVIMIIVQ